MTISQVKYKKGIVTTQCRKFQKALKYIYQVKIHFEILNKPNIFFIDNDKKNKRNKKNNEIVYLVY